MCEIVYKFRDTDTEGKLKVFLECKEPAFLVDMDSETRLKYGEYTTLLELLSIYALLGNVAVFKAPKNQEELDELFQCGGKLQKWVRKMKEIDKQSRG